MEECCEVMHAFINWWHVKEGERRRNALGMRDAFVCVCVYVCVWGGGCGLVGYKAEELEIIVYSRSMGMWRGFEHGKTVWLWVAKPGFRSAVFGWSVCGWEFKANLVRDTQKEATVLPF